MIKHPNQQYDNYLCGIISDFERNSKIREVTEPGFAMHRYYAGLRMSELISRLRINLTYCENHSIFSDQYKAAKRIVEVPLATSPNCV